jgi:hypothetical protein
MVGMRVRRPSSAPLRLPPGAAPSSLSPLTVYNVMSELNQNM